MTNTPSSLTPSSLLQSTPALYVFAITIWGSTWYGIKMQLGVVPPEISTAYRFLLAAIVLFGWLKIQKKTLSFTLKHHIHFLILGISLFSISYLLAYYAGGLIPSGLNSVLFSVIMLFNIFNTAVFFKSKISLLTLVGALISLFGLSLVFLPQILSVDPNSKTQILGMAYSVIGAFFGSIGNIVSSKLSKDNVGVLQSNAYSMMYGGLCSLIFAICIGKPVIFEYTAEYIGSLIYLAVFGSVITFGCYLTIVSRVGPDRAALPMVGVPIVALLISELLEDYTWSSYALFGICMMLFGNLMVVAKGKKELLKECLQKIRSNT